MTTYNPKSHKRTLKPQQTTYRDPQLLTIVQYAAQYENSRCVWLTLTHDDAMDAYAMTISHLRGQCYRYTAELKIKLLNDSLIFFVSQGNIQHIRGTFIDYIGLHKKVSIDDTEYIDVIKPTLRDGGVCVRSWSPVDAMGEVVNI